MVNGQTVETKAAVDHMITFENVALQDGENTVTAFCGEVKGNAITLCGVPEHDYSYDLPDGNQGANWFDDPKLVELKKAFKYPKDAYSLKDKIGVLMANPQTAAILQKLMEQVMGAMGGLMDASSVSEEMMGFLQAMRLSDMLKMAGDKIPMEVKLQLNQALNAVKK